MLQPENPALFPFNTSLILPALLIAMLVTACSSEPKDQTTPLYIRSLATVLGLTGDPTTGRTLPAITDPKAQLGMKLFFSKALSGDKDTACASCHHPALAGGDALSLPIGVGAVDPDVVGPGRVHGNTVAGGPNDGGPTVPRNAPTTFNVGLFDQVLFLDGRVESITRIRGVNGDDGFDGSTILTPDSVDRLTADPNAANDNLPMAQARFEVTSDIGMQGFGAFAGLDHDGVRSHLEQRIGDYGDLVGDLSPNGWLAAFQAGFESTETDPAVLITFDHIVEAIGEYERSQIFVYTPWKAFMEGDDNAISLAARRGALVFMLTKAHGGAGCVSCHRGDFFTDERFYVLGMPQIGRGEGDADTGTDDFGRFRVTAVDTDKYAFRTPPLLNVTETGPWGHDGAFTTLEAAIRYHLNPQAAFDSYDVNQLEASIVSSGQTTDTQTNTQNALDTLASNRARGIASIQTVDLTDQQVADLLEFMSTLADPCITDRACLDSWIPTTGTGPDGLQLNAKDGQGNPL
jgi:cytochrome c peroxidase